MPLGLEEISQAQTRCYGGQALTPAYDFSKAEVVLSLGADFLGTWISPVEHARRLGEGPQGRGPGQVRPERYKDVEVLLLRAHDDDHGRECGRALSRAPGRRACGCPRRGWRDRCASAKPARFAGDGNLSAVLATYQAGAIEKELGLPGRASSPARPTRSGTRKGRESRDRRRHRQPHRRRRSRFRSRSIF